MSRQRKLRMPRLHLTRGSRIKPRRRWSEAAVRRMIDEFETGKPNYDLMGPGLAEPTRRQLPQLQSMIAAMGALQSVIFKGVGPGGADIYQVNFEKGSIDYRIWLGADE